MPAEFKIKLVEKPSRHLLERYPRYDIMLNGKPAGELYRNMTGYVGTLPSISGARMDIGERGIAAFRKEIAILNKEAATAIAAQETSPRRITMIRPTDDSRDLFVISDDGAERRAHIVSRSAVQMAQDLFGKDASLGMDFFQEEDLPYPRVAQIYPGDEALLAEFPDVPFRLLDSAQEEEHFRYIEEAFPTSDMDTMLVISCRVLDDVDPEPHFVDTMSYRIGVARYGDNLRLGDLRPAVEVPITDPAARAHMRANFTWFDCDEPICPETRTARAAEIEAIWQERRVALTPDERQEILNRLSPALESPGV